MGKKSKLCKMVKKDFLEENIKAYMKLVNEPEYICVKCGRVANDDAFLCKSMKLAK